MPARSATFSVSPTRQCPSNYASSIRKAMNAMTSIISARRVRVNFTMRVIGRHDAGRCSRKYRARPRQKSPLLERARRSPAGHDAHITTFFSCAPGRRSSRAARRANTAHGAMTFSWSPLIRAEVGAAPSIASSGQLCLIYFQLAFHVAAIFPEKQVDFAVCPIFTGLLTPADCVPIVDTILKPSRQSMKFL